jgi:transcriptional regulator with XRE-family HTH domain
MIIDMPYMNALDKAFGNAVRHFRAEAGFSQEELAFLANLHRTYISQLERGIKSPSLKVISQLAKGLNTQAFLLVQLAEQILSSEMDSNQDESST